MIIHMVALSIVSMSIGVAVTYALIMRKAGSADGHQIAEKPDLQPQEQTHAPSDPFASVESDLEGRFGLGPPSGYSKSDLTEPSERDLLVSFWYLQMKPVVEELEFHTGHRFLKVGKLFASPEQILNEQLEFMVEFQRRTEELSSER